MTNSFAKGQEWEGKSYTGILILSVLCDYANQAASYWSSVPHHPKFVFGIGGHSPLPPLVTPLPYDILQNYATSSLRIRIYHRKRQHNRCHAAQQSQKTDILSATKALHDARQSDNTAGTKAVTAIDGVTRCRSHSRDKKTQCVTCRELGRADQKLG